jgi:pilus assembly protein CpaE
MTTAPAKARPPSALVTVSVVDRDNAVRAVLADLLSALECEVRSYPDLGALTKSENPSEQGVVVFGPSEPADEVMGRVPKLLSSGSGRGVVMVVDELTADVLKHAMRAGVDDVVGASADAEELLDAIGRASARVMARIPAGGARGATSSPTQGKVITVFCTKGGTGKSVVAVNLAVALAKRTIQPVVLVDADLQFGDVALMLQLQPTHTIVDSLHSGDRLDGSMLENLLLRHPASGLLVLAAPTEPSSADQIGRADVSRILSVLRERCAYVIVDTSANFAEVTLAALESADDILVLAGLDVMSLKSARVGLQTMRILGIPFSRVKFVLNRANTRVGLTEADAERALQLKVDVALPSDIVVAESVNRGVPVVTSAPRSKFAKSIDDLAEMVMATAPAATGSTRVK